MRARKTVKADQQVEPEAPAPELKKGTRGAGVTMNVKLPLALASAPLA